MTEKTYIEKFIFIFTLLFSTLFSFWSCNNSCTFDLAIEDVKLFDPETKMVAVHKTILINSDTIAAIVDAGEKINAVRLLKGNNRLVTPGFINTHIHLADIIGDYESAPDTLHPDSIPVYKNRLTREYLPYGITTVRDAGHSENWMDVSLEWQNNPSPDFPNLYICGAAIISDEEREPYPGHVEVKDPQDGAKKVLEYYERGIRYIKLYWRLREPDMKSIVKTADSLGMNIFGHIDINIVTISTAMDLGVKHFEHVFTPFMSVFSYAKHWTDFRQKYVQNFENDSYWTGMLEVIRYVDSIPELRQE
nr:amidohydrolase family protein [Bacteroidota bacterium]